MSDNCANCGELIGALETPYVWENHVVCEQCHRRLARKERVEDADDAQVSSSSIPEKPTDGRDGAYSCPKCGSTDTKKLSVVYHSGTRTGTSTSTSVGAAFDDDGAAPLIAGTSTTSVQQSNLAAMASPPQRPELKSPAFGITISIVLIVGGAIAFATKIDDRFERPIGVFGAVLAVVGTVVLILVARSYRARAETHRIDMAQYHKSYQFWQKRIMCMRCGNVYIPDASSER